MVQAGQVRTGAVAGLMAALAYGATGEVLFQKLDEFLIGTLSISFLVLVPMGIGVLTVKFAPDAQKGSWPYAVFAPWLVCLVLGLVVTVLAMEAWVCVLMALPLFCVLSSVGGALMRWWYARHRERNGQLLGLLLLAPLLLAPLEARWHPPTTTRTVATSIELDASPAAVWEQIIAVPEIQPGEGGFAWFPWLGLPQPLAATLREAGPTAIRHATYRNGFGVVEPVRVWEPYARYRFDVELDPARVQATPLWTAVASNHVDVQWVEYVIEPLGPAWVRLHLMSQYTLTSPVNGYATVWIDFVLRDFQQYILRVVGTCAVEFGEERLRLPEQQAPRS